MGHMGCASGFLDQGQLKILKVYGYETRSMDVV